MDEEGMGATLQLSMIYDTDQSSNLAMMVWQCSHADTGKLVQLRLSLPLSRVGKSVAVRKFWDLTFLSTKTHLTPAGAV